MTATADDTAWTEYMARLDRIAAEGAEREKGYSRPAPSLLAVSRTLPRPGPSALHEGGHGVAAVLLDRPLDALLLDAGGGLALGGGDLNTAEDLIAEAAVSAAGAAAEFFFAYSLEGRDGGEVVEYLSDGDRRSLDICATRFAENFPGEVWPWPFNGAARVFARPGAEVAVRAVAGLLQHRGKLTGGEVAQVVREAVAEARERMRGGGESN